MLLPPSGTAPLVAALAVVVPLLAALLLPRDARLAARLAPRAAWAAFALAAFAALTVAFGGPSSAVFAQAGPWLALGVHLDAVSATMLLLVSFIGAVVTGYSRAYLDGDARHRRFTRWLLLTLAAVLSLVVSGNLALFGAAWVATSLALHQLLLHYPERPAAQLAARKKFVFGRIADLCLLAAIVLTAQAFGSLEFRVVLASAAELAAAGQSLPQVPAIALLVAIAALIKSAQFPFHGWLPEVMETPTPVSALLHAGIINAGGFLVVRMSPVVALSAPALDLLLVVGAFTALFAAAVMLTQTSVKVSLAWSTCAQMGFMLLQCGLGAFALALLHIVAHSLYKAHAFLASGSVVDAMRGAPKAPAAAPSTPLAVGAAAGALALAGSVAWVIGLDAARHPGTWVLGGVLALALAHLLLQARGTGRAGGLRVLAIGAAVLAAYFALAAAARAVFGGAVAPDVPVASVADGVAPALVLFAFAAAFVVQARLPALGAHPRLRAAYVHLSNGLYVNAHSNRLVQALWPITMPAARPAAVAAQGEQG